MEEKTIDKEVVEQPKEELPKLTEEQLNQLGEAFKKAHTPWRRRYTKIGRNDFCPCGSGKKYKKCCINKIEEEYTVNY